MLFSENAFFDFVPASLLNASSQQLFMVIALFYPSAMKGNVLLFAAIDQSSAVFCQRKLKKAKGWRF